MSHLILEEDKRRHVDKDKFAFFCDELEEMKNIINKNQTPTGLRNYMNNLKRIQAYEECLVQEGCHHNVENPEYRTSLTDCVFTCWCVALVSSKEDWVISKPPSAREIPDVMALLRILICRHTLTPLLPPPTSKELNEMTQSICMLVTHVYSEYEKGNEALKAMKKWPDHPLRKHLQDHYESYPVNTLHEAVKSPNQGNLWTPSELYPMDDFMKLCVRYMRHVAMEATLLSRYPVMDMEKVNIKYGRITKRHVEKFDAWMVTRSVSTSEALTKKHRHWLYQQVLPIGSVFTYHRNPASRAVKDVYHTLLARELGRDTAAFITETTALTPARIHAIRNATAATAADPKSKRQADLSYEYLQLSTFDYMMSHECGVRFQDHFHISALECETNFKEVLNKLDTKTVWKAFPTRPKIIPLRQTWFVWDQGSLIPCEDGVRGAILRWISIMATNAYKHTTVDGMNLNPFLSKFMDKEPEEEEKKKDDMDVIVNPHNIKRGKSEVGEEEDG